MDDVNAVDVKVGEPVTLAVGETMTFAHTVRFHADGTQNANVGPAYVERNGVLEVFLDWNRPFVDP